MATIGNLVVGLEARTAAFMRDMQRAERQVTSSSARMNRALRRFQLRMDSVRRSTSRTIRSMTSMRSITATLVGSAGLGLLVKRALDTADAIGKVADKVGVTTTQLQELRFAADIAGVSQQTLDMALQRFSRRIGEVAQGQGELLKTAQQYNVMLRTAEGRMRSNIDILGDFAEVVRRAESDQERLRIAFKLFDSEGAALVNLLRQGRAGIEELRAEAQRLGLVIEDDMIRRAESAQDALTRLGSVVQANLTRAVLAAAPSIERMANALARFVPQTIAFLERFVDPADAGLAELTRRIGEMDKEISRLEATMSRAADIDPSGIFGLSEAATAATLERLRRERAELERQLELRRELTRTFAASPGAGVPPAQPAAPALPPVPRPNPFIADPAFVERMQAAIDRLDARKLDDMRRAAERLFRETRTPQEEFNMRIAELNRMLEVGAIDYDLYGRAVEQAGERLDAMTGFASRGLDGVRRSTLAARTAMEDLARAGGAALEDLIVRARSAQDVFRALIETIQRALLRRFITGPLESALGGALGGGGIFGLGRGVLGGSLGTFVPSSLGPQFTGTNLLAAGSFQHGGSFVVGGRGGTDRNLVAFRATRGERVTVEPAASARARGGAPVTVVQNIRVEAGVSQTVRAEMMALLPRFREEAQAAVIEAFEREPSLRGPGGG